MVDDHSREWKRAAAEFARTQKPSKPAVPNEPIASRTDVKTACLRAARLARDAADDKGRL